MEQFKNKNVTIHYYAEVNTGIGVWSGYATDESYKEGMTKITELIEDKGIKTWTGYMTELKVISPELQKWTEEVWFPRALSGGLKYIAIVVSKGLIGRMSVEQIMQKTDAFTTRYFGDLEEAKAWIKTVA